MNLLKSPSRVLNSHFTCGEQFCVSFMFLWSPYMQKIITEFFFLSNIKSSCMSDSRHVTDCWYMAYQRQNNVPGLYHKCHLFQKLSVTSFFNFSFHYRYDIEKRKGSWERTKDFKAKSPNTNCSFIPAQGVHQKRPCLKQSREWKGEVEFCVLKSISIPHECLL